MVKSVKDFLAAFKRGLSMGKQAFWRWGNIFLFVAGIVALVFPSV